MTSFVENSDMCFFRLSSFDMQAQIALFKKIPLVKETHQEAWPEEYDDYTMDSMLYGVDYISSTVAMMPQSNAVSEVKKDIKNLHVDKNINNVKCIPFKSNFHRISRGMRYRRCSSVHLPFEDCPLCWVHHTSPNSNGETPIEHPLDACMPLPGLTLYVAIAEPLELNVDRESLEAIGLLKALFSSSKEPKKMPTEERPTIENVQMSSVLEKENSEFSPSSTRDASSDLDGQVPASSTGSFPGFMQPNAIQITGLHLAKVILRLHIMRAAGDRESGLSFCYWEMVAHSITVDMQECKAPELAFTDTKFDVGQMDIFEMKGVGRRCLLCIGTEPVVNDAESVPAIERAFSCKASNILDISLSNEMLSYYCHDGHAIRMQFIQTSRPKEKHSTIDIVPDQSSMDLSFGYINADIPSYFSSEVSHAQKEAWKSLNSNSGQDNFAQSVEQKKNENPNDSIASSEPTTMEYNVQFDGGKAELFSYMKCAFPSTRFTGQRSSLDGLSVETVLNHVHINYGTYRPHNSLKQVLIPAAQMAALPESLQLHILLYLDDMTPLAQALGLSSVVGGNIILQCREICAKFADFPAKKTHDARGKRRHKGKKSKRLRKPRLKGSLPKTSNTSERRQYLISKLSGLDEEALEDMLATHLKANSKSSMMNGIR